MTQLRTRISNKLRHWLGYGEICRELDHYRLRAEADVASFIHLLEHHQVISLGQDARRASLLARLVGTSIDEGLYVCNSLSRVASIPGDVCEFGVAQGATSALIANEIAATGKSLWLYDSFEGLPAPTREDVLIDDIFALGSMEKYAGTMRCSETEVTSRLDQIHFPSERYWIVKGYFANTPETRGPDTISFAYIDFDFYKPIKDALEFVDERTAGGAQVIVDDYGFFSAGAKTAVDEFVSGASGRWELSLPLPFCAKFCVLKKRA